MSIGSNQFKHRVSKAHGDIVHAKTNRQIILTDAQVGVCIYIYTYTRTICICQPYIHTYIYMAASQVQRRRERAAGDPTVGVHTRVIQPKARDSTIQSLQFKVQQYSDVQGAVKS